MGEQYVRPPLVPREPPPAWIAVWRFRLIALLLLVVLVMIGYRAFREFSGATDQDPGLNSMRTSAAR
jgi:hypothetical protein